MSNVTMLQCYSAVPCPMLQCYNVTVQYHVQCLTVSEAAHLTAFLTFHDQSEMKVKLQHTADRQTDSQYRSNYMFVCLS